jgi:hypothetical protein
VPTPPPAPEGGNGGSTDVGVAATEIKIGGAFFNGGFLDKYSRSSEQAAAAYFNLINDNGGIYGRKIKYVTCDTQGSADGTQQCARRLVEQRSPVLGDGASVLRRAPAALLLLEPASAQAGRTCPSLTCTAKGRSGASAGPRSTSPDSVKREPWHGQPKPSPSGLTVQP